MLERVEAARRAHAIGTTADPVLLEVFNNLFMAIAEQMGVTLANTAYSVNIKERLDFSCALFDADGNLIANAPHMPVHLGSMGESVKTIIERRARHDAPRRRVRAERAVQRRHASARRDGDRAGVPRREAARAAGVLRRVARPPRRHRRHHAGLDAARLDARRRGRRAARQRAARRRGPLPRGARCARSSAPGRYPSRNVDQNLADLRAQVAACAKGAEELAKMVAHFGLPVVRAYMRHVQDNAEEAVRRVLDVLKDGHFEYEMDSGARIAVTIAIDKARREATIDFTGTSAAAADQLQRAVRGVQGGGALRVPHAGRRRDPDERRLPQAAVASSFREGSMLAPRYPAAVVAGNVETSQAVTDTLYGALGVLAASQGTMNNFTFGNATYQYYETISGGSGAGPDFDGASVVQTHMTNSRLTDPEVLEWRFPVRLESYAIRRGSGGAGRHRGGDGARAARALPRADDGGDARQSSARRRRSASRAARRAPSGATGSSAPTARARNSARPVRSKWRPATSS